MSYELKLQEGDPAPAFSAPVNGGGGVALADYAGKNVVLFFIRGTTRPAARRRPAPFATITPR